MSSDIRHFLVKKLKQNNARYRRVFLTMQAQQAEEILKRGLVEPNDFALQCNAFLDKMKHSSSFDLVKSIKKFITAFLQDADNPMPIEQQVEKIRVFILDTAAAIAKHPLWRGENAEELDITSEALERYVMHKIHKAAYSPKREDDQRKDCEFSYKVRSLKFVTPEHLDIKNGPLNERAFQLASEHISELSAYRSPRDKVTCLMNCCTIICNLLNDDSDGTVRGADDLLPMVIFVVIKAQPQTWWSDIRFIQRFRNPQKLSSEAGYYLTQMMGAVAFIEKADAKSFNIDEDEFARLSSHSLSRLSPDPIRSQSSVAEQLNDTKTDQEHSLKIGHEDAASGLAEDEPVVVQKFLESKLEELTIGELGHLLEGYKVLAAFYQEHKKNEA
ncbi:uncharacterized protein LOC134182740 [Corticium candelabrum]|uniref:uncharacterized protein LOC134182740 n=1 Tax=Corticium candelabrum TaxID=121492 RepID=UPI002E26ED7A|nr:uncharacterized protein LOC134182740 [Corticium candelabrum]